MNVVVVGAGPCGVAAALQLKRSGIPTYLFERDQVGGLLRNAHLVENYPGFPRGIAGEALCRLLEKHLKAGGIVPISEEVSLVSPVKRGYRVSTPIGREIEASVVLIATGTRPNTGILPDEKALSCSLVYYEVKDLLAESWKEGTKVAIIGGGDAAYDYALNLAGRGFEVVLLQRSAPRCLPLLKERVALEKRIEIHAHTAVEHCLEDGDGLKMELNAHGSRSVMKADRLLLACGRIPRDRLIRTMKAPRPGLYTGGDLVRGSFRQAGIAVGDGLKAAMAAMRYMADMCEKKRKPEPGDEGQH